MKLYRIWQEVNNNYDTYDSAVVAAQDEEDARSINPSSINFDDLKFKDYSTWTERENVKVEYIGEAADNIERSIICASFNAG